MYVKDVEDIKTSHNRFLTVTVTVTAPVTA